MQKLGYTLIVSILVLSACGPKTDNDKKLAKYEKAKKELADQQAKVHELKSELLEAGVIEEADNRSLVTTFEIKPKDFERKIDIRGTVKSKGNITISPETAGQVTKVLVKEGENVKEGQTLVIQDAEVLRNNIAELNTSLSLATTMYEKQKALWKKNIGSEVQYLEAENNKKSLERKLTTAKSQLNKSIIRAPFSGVIDLVDVRVGESIMPGQPIIRLVSMSNMYIKADVSESYIGKFSTGQDVDIYFPSSAKEIHSKISAIGQVIEPENRTFELEVLIPTNSNTKPNMIAVLKIADYAHENAITVPTNIIFTDNNGAFVYQLKKADGKDVAIRSDVTVGITAGTKTEILSGLKEGDIVIDKGIYDISSGSQVNVVK